ncbi:interferon-induced 35 kDa protein isoform X2 [Hyperolius riggenbachi]|uniref:interferon-induced 35 kDa protein isoform X2 n=1 Tax=Hyperolius riggenbachi TaxID=752182 RepID=UPI0035A29AFD
MRLAACLGLSIADKHTSKEFELTGEEEMGNPQKLEAEIQKYKDQYSSIMVNLDNLEEDKKKTEDLVRKFQERVDKTKAKITENEEIELKNEQSHKANLESIKEDNIRLEQKIKEIRKIIDSFDEETERMKEVSSSGMQRPMVFKRTVSNNTGGLVVKHNIKYPIDGGSALITFQEPSVAAEIISKKDHTISIDDCRINVRAQPVEVSVLDSLFMRMSISPTKILVYNLPANLSQEVILDKLELFFGKSRNSGGEVEKREFLEDCRSAILTFVNTEVAPRLVARKTFHVPFGETSHQVSVVPSLEGHLQDYKMTMLKCNRTVLITGIPDITDRDNMRDLLEIHFQKASNNGGEVQELLYCPEQQNTTAFFRDDEEDAEEF